MAHRFRWLADHMTTGQAITLFALGIIALGAVFSLGAMKDRTQVQQIKDTQAVTAEARADAQRAADAAQVNGRRLRAYAAAVAALQEQVEEQGGTPVVDMSTLPPAQPVAGPRGRPGQDGQDGQDGEDSTVAGPRGQRGEDGQDSTVPGPPGPSGRPGMDATGRPGRDGEDGQDGQDGQDSTIPGPAGPPGENGETGPPGRGVSTITCDVDTRTFVVYYTDGTSEPILNSECRASGPLLPAPTGS